MIGLLQLEGKSAPERRIKAVLLEGTGTIDRFLIKWAEWESDEQGDQTSQWTGTQALSLAEEGKLCYVVHSIHFKEDPEDVRNAKKALGLLKLLAILLATTDEDWRAA